MRKHTPGPWVFSKWNQFGDTRFYVAQAEGAPYTPDYSDVATLIAETVSSDRVAIQEANARLIAAAPELLEELQARIKNDEQSAFEDWLRITCPSGDVESVQRQWEESSLYADFLADTAKARAIIAKAEAA